MASNLRTQAMTVIGSTESKRESFLGKRRGPWHQYIRLHPSVVLVSLLALLVLGFIELSSQRPLFELRVWQSQLAYYLQWRSPEQTHQNISLDSQLGIKKSPDMQKFNESDHHPRVAVCLVGGARAFELTGPSIMKYVLLVNKRTDVFVNAPLDRDSHKFSLLKDFPNLVVVRIFNPELLPESPIHKELLTASGSPNGIQGLLQYFRLVEGCWDLIHAHQVRQSFTYDWIVRTRVDGFWNGPLPPLENCNPESYTIPEGSEFGGLNDRLGIGSLQTSKIALSRLSQLPHLYSEGLRSLNSESTFKNQLKISQIKYELKKFPFCILSYRSYGWPPGTWGVPVLSISSKGPLNGAKCRPCTPVATGEAAKALLEAQARHWAWMGYGDGLNLCDPQGDWEANWEDVFDRTGGVNFAEIRKKVQNRNSTDCIVENEEFQKQVETWDAPSPSTICKKGFGF